VTFPIEENKIGKGDFVLYGNLRRLLGGMIYNPMARNIVPSWDHLQKKHGRDWRPNVKIENESSEEATLWLKLHTVSVGRSNKDTFAWLRTHWDEDYYQYELKSKTYFSVSYLSVFLNPLVREETNVKYVEWKKEHISIIPVFSADFLHYFIKDLPKTVRSNSALKDGAAEIDYYLAFVDASKKITETLLLKWIHGTMVNQDDPICQELKNSAIYKWLNGAEGFPLWEENNCKPIHVLISEDPWVTFKFTHDQVKVINKCIESLTKTLNAIKDAGADQVSLIDALSSYKQPDGLPKAVIAYTLVAHNRSVGMIKSSLEKQKGKVDEHKSKLKKRFELTKNNLVYALTNAQIVEQDGQNT
jgi:hypothetical protein